LASLEQGLEAAKEAGAARLEELAKAHAASTEQAARLEGRVAQEEAKVAGLQAWLAEMKGEKEAAAQREASRAVEAAEERAAAASQLAEMTGREETLASLEQGLEETLASLEQGLEAAKEAGAARLEELAKAHAASTEQAARRNMPVCTPEQLSVVSTELEATRELAWSEKAMGQTTREKGALEDGLAAVSEGEGAAMREVSGQLFSAEEARAQASEEVMALRERLQVGDDGRARQEGEAAWLVWVEEELARVAVDMDALKELAQSAERAKGEAEAGILEAQERNAQLATQVKRALHVPEKCSV
jgi:hypothetical protein